MKTFTWLLSLALFLLCIPGGVLFLFLLSLLLSARLTPLPAEHTAPALCWWLCRVWVLPGLVLLWVWLLYGWFGAGGGLA